MKTLLNILSYSAIYKDAFREVGLLEVMVTCLHRYAALLKAQQDGAGTVQLVVLPATPFPGFVWSSAVECRALNRLSGSNPGSRSRELGFESPLRPFGYFRSLHHAPIRSAV